MKILLTGATGTLGSQVVFCLLEENLSSLDRLYLLVREKKSTSPKMRIVNMLESEFAPAFIKKNIDEILTKITVVSTQDILHPERFLCGVQITHFIHLAGFVNLSVLPEAKEEIYKENFHFTQAIFEAYAGVIDKFIYISTAFSIGNVGGLIANDYLKVGVGEYRNHYEASKYASEQYLVEAGALANVPIQILRPSVLGGNVMDGPSFFISKYMVFYLFAKFFHKNASGECVRITAHEDSGLNIIPTDYAAKVIVSVFDTDIEQLNIVHSKTTPITKGITKILDTVSFNNFKFTNKKVTTAAGFESTLEKFYYDTIGLHLMPYLTSKPCEWDTTLLEKILPIPAYNLEKYLGDTIKCAQDNGFKSQQW